jgi:excisionase family DNA binding protein
MEDEILTVEQVAQILKVHRFTVLKFIKQNRLTASKLGRVYRIRKSEVERFLDSQSTDKSERTKKKTTKVVTEPKVKQKEVEEKKGSKETLKGERKNTNDIDHYVLQIKDEQNDF